MTLEKSHAVESLAQMLHASYSDGFAHGLHYPDKVAGRQEWGDISEEKREQWREAATIWLSGRGIVATIEAKADQYGLDPAYFAELFDLGQRFEPGDYRAFIMKL